MGIGISGVSHTRFWDGLTAHGESVALIENGRKVSYQELDQMVGQMASHVTTRSLAFVLCENTLGSVVGYLGLLRQRVVAVLLSASVDNEMLNKLLDTYRPQYVWCPACCSEASGSFDAWGYKLFETGYDAPHVGDNLALMLTTSGSTGSPKFVRQSYENIESNTTSIVEYLKIVSTDRAITTLPMNYTYGLSILQSHLMAGASIVLTRMTILDRGFWSLLKEVGATNFGAVPYTYQMLDRLRFLRMDLPTLRYVTQAGGRLGEELHERFGRGMRESGKALVVMYGATEATARMSYVPAESAVEKAGSIGIPIPGGRFEIVGTNGEAIEESGEIGELIYYGPNVALGYAQSRDDLSKGDEWHGRLETGDMALRDDDGYYYIVGRKKRFLKIFGNRVNLTEVEEMLAQAGYETACVGVDDRMVIYTTNGDADAISELLARRTKLNRSAFDVRSIPEMPRSESGKVLYSELSSQ